MQLDRSVGSQKPIYVNMSPSVDSLSDDVGKLNLNNGHTSPVEIRKVTDGLYANIIPQPTERVSMKRQPRKKEEEVTEKEVTESSVDEPCEDRAPVDCVVNKQFELEQIRVS